MALLNALDCSADEIICKELQTARPIVNSWLPDPFHGNTSCVEGICEQKTGEQQDQILREKSVLKTHLYYYHILPNMNCIYNTSV